VKHSKKKLILLLIAVTLLVLVAVGGTLAYLVAATTPVENVFQPSKVNTKIDEDKTTTSKSSVTIVNQNDSTDAFVRVAVTGNWVKDGKIVRPWEGSIKLNTEPDDKGGKWVKDGEYYYYTRSLKPNEETSNLLGETIVAGVNDDEHLEIVITQQAVQAEGKIGDTKAVEDAWGIDPTKLQ